MSLEAVAEGNRRSSVVETVCCGRRPKARRYRKKSSLFSFRRKSQFFDTDGGNDSVWDDADSMFYFDAEEEQLEDDVYPIVFTTALEHPKPNVSLDQPESMMRKSKGSTLERHESEPLETANPRSARFERQDSDPIENHRKPSIRFHKIARRATLEQHTALASPRIRLTEQGYPGELSFEELAECQKFLRGLKLLDPGVSEQVYSFRDIEEEPYTVCRWLRATKFDAEKILQRLEENQEMFEQAKQQEFFPDVSKAIGAPFSVFLSQYPFLPIGRGKNGCPVNYFQAGKIHPEGILAISSIARIQGYFWWSFMWKMKEEIRKAQEGDPDFVRIEGINIIDLQGLSASALSAETMEVIKLASKISDFFPETLHCMLVLNAPKFFSMSWVIIRKFIDPRTAQRIQVFSSGDKGLRALHKMVDESQIPVDYGGTNKSIKQSFTEESADPTLLRQEIELVHAKKKNIGTTNQTWELQKGEYMTIRVYTRSVSSAAITVRVNGAIFKTVQAQSICEEETEDPIAHSTLAVSKLIGPGEVTVEARDLDNAQKMHHGKSRGYFLIVGDIKSNE